MKLKGKGNLATKKGADRKLYTIKLHLSDGGDRMVRSRGRVSKMYLHYASVFLGFVDKYGYAYNPDGAYVFGKITHLHILDCTEIKTIVKVELL
jgi:hypothetical protein